MSVSWKACSGLRLCVWALGKPSGSASHSSCMSNHFIDWALRPYIFFCLEENKNPTVSFGSWDERSHGRWGIGQGCWGLQILLEAPNNLYCAGSTQSRCATYRFRGMADTKQFQLALTVPCGISVVGTCQASLNLLSLKCRRTVGAPTVGSVK